MKTRVLSTALMVGMLWSCAHSGANNDGSSSEDDGQALAPLTEDDYADDPELMDVEAASNLIAKLEATWPSHGPAELQSPQSLEDVLQILKLDQVSLFDKGVAFAQTQKGLEARALEAQIELAWGESYLTALEIMLHLSEELEAEQEVLTGQETRTAEQDEALAWIVSALKRTDQLAQATELLSIQHVTRGASKAEEVIAAHPDSYLGYRVAADYYRMVADWAKFKAMLAKIEELNPDSNGLVFQKGASAHQRDGDASEAEKHLRQALAKEPAFVRAQAHLVALQPNISKMYAEYEVLKKLNPDHQIVHLVGESIERAHEKANSHGKGHLEREQIQKVINENVSQIQRCYERQLLETPGLSGKITVQWVIATSGRISSTRQVQSSLPSSVVDCIMGKIRDWTFPQPEGGSVTVTYPFIFKSVGF